MRVNVVQILSNWTKRTRHQAMFLSNQAIYKSLWDKMSLSCKPWFGTNKAGPTKFLWQWQNVFVTMYLLLVSHLTYKLHFSFISLSFLGSQCLTNFKFKFFPSSHFFKILYHFTNYDFIHIHLLSLTFLICIFFHFS
jgi:hypothetical protein